MKKITLLAVTVITALSAIFSAHAAHPDRLPFGSQQELRIYAFERVKKVGLYADSVSIIQSSPTNTSYLWMDYPKTNGVTDIAELVAFISKQRLNLSLLYTQHMVSVYSYLYDEENQMLFYPATVAMKALKPSGTGSVTNLFDLLFNMNSEIAVVIPDADWVQIIETDENGNPTEYFYPQNSWKVGTKLYVRFPSYYAGRNGRVVVSYNDGTQVAYGLNNGGRALPTTSATASIGAVKFNGVSTFKNSNVQIRVTDEEYENNIAPIAQIRLDEARSFSLTALIPATGENATAVKVWLVGTPEPEEATTVIRGLALIGRQPGLYWIKPIFASGFGTDESEFQKPGYWYGSAVTEKGL